jgi:SWI/SNF-related matrix-associated actin-dependent regulator of chromatin subfamily A-like protein 1
MPVIAKMKRIMLLSGTPMLARPVELYNCLRLIRPDIFSNFNAYVNRYCDPKGNSFGRRRKDNTGSAHTNELHYLMQQEIMIRRLKKQVLSQLPPKIRSKVRVNTDP